MAAVTPPPPSMRVSAISKSRYPGQVTRMVPLKAKVSSLSGPTPSRSSARSLMSKVTIPSSFVVPLIDLPLYREVRVTSAPGITTLPPKAVSTTWTPTSLGDTSTILVVALSVGPPSSSRRIAPPDSSAYAKGASTRKPPATAGSTVSEPSAIRKKFRRVSAYLVSSVIIAHMYWLARQTSPRIGASLGTRGFSGHSGSWQSPRP